MSRTYLNLDAIQDHSIENVKLATPYDDSSIWNEISNINNKIGDIESVMEFCLSGEEVE